MKVVIDRLGETPQTRLALAVRASEANVDEDKDYLILAEDDPRVF